ncbi:Sirohydrochlorin cobaltochelatase CbiK [Lachnospiraceae bacterium TWA4]|nr:Sirohydrochlorin cobaltochelatase CbiK [Lachnospiraceae bacterium TWA4]
MSETTKAILVVSFGTSINETRKKTIDVIEESVRSSYPGYKVYRAWTSKMIIRKLQKRDDVHIFTVDEAMKQMIADGIKTLIVQPTHIINGIENDIMKDDVLAYENKFDSISFGTPLLTTTEDNETVIRAVAKEFSNLPEDEVLVLMGHGSEHHSNTVYAALDYTFKDFGYSNMFMGTVEAYPSIDEILKQVKSYNPTKVHLAPFMVVAGDHAQNDMAGEEEDSWKSQFEANGFNVECHIKGLGEMDSIRNLYLEHIEAAINN